MAYKGLLSTNSDIGELVRKSEDNYIHGSTTISKYVQTSMHEDLNKIDAYLNSKHTTGDTDSLGREKPFFNIVTAAVNIWYRATVIKLNKIRLKAVKAKDTIDAFLANVHLQDWIRREKFGAFLSDWGRTLSRYGSAVVKFVEKDGKLHCSVIPWQRLIVDPVDFDSNIKIEILELTEAQLYQREGYDPDIIEKLCDAREARETLEGHDKDTKSDYIKLYEVHGNLPLSYLTGKESDTDTYVQQMHVISFVASKAKGEFDDFTLVSGREAKDPYMITHLIEEDGQTLSTGAVKHLFEAQWMMNHTVKSIKDQLDLASKLIFQTSDPTFVGQNALSSIETGDILIHKVNEGLTQVNNNSHDITSLQNFGNQWKALSNEITGISESMLGNTAPSGTAWRQVETLLQQNQSLFEVMRDNKGLYIEDMFRTYVIPFLKKKMDTSKEVSATLELYDIEKIDSKFIKNKSITVTNETIKEKLLNKKEVTPEEQAVMIQGEQMALKESLSELGNQRFFKPSEISDKTWKAQFVNLEWDLEVDTKDEQVDNDAVTTLNTLLGTIASNPMVLQDPNMKMIVNKILAKTGQVSPIELTKTSPLQPQLPAASQPIT